MSSPIATRSRWPWALLGISAAAGTLAFFFPAFVIRPFAYQAPRALWWAMAIRQRAPLISLLCLPVCIAASLNLWRTSRIWGRVALILVMIPVTFSAVMSRLNYFEWMFHPVDSPRFDAEAASKLDKSEMVLAVRFGGDARAYPIREMAYHHVLNDVVGSVPIAVTY